MESDNITTADGEEKPDTTNNGLLDTFSIAISTFGVGYLPLAPGTWGSIIGVAIYLGVYLVEFNVGIYLLHGGWQGIVLESWLTSFTLIALVLFTLLSIWAAGRSAKVFGEKDPQKTVVDEITGQLVTFLFIPFTTSWMLILAGFLLFRFFDIFKPYPVDRLQDLPGGLGVVADDIVAGVYAGILLNIIYSVSFLI